jgi:hypothetical protein
MKIKYPDIEVELVGQDGNAYSILGRVNRALAAVLVPRNASSSWTRPRQGTTTISCRPA